MKNKEKYKDRIVEIAVNGRNFGLTKDTKVIKPCADTSCYDCYFNDKINPCRTNKRMWANAEAEVAKEEKVEKLKEYCMGKHYQECAFYDFAGCCCDFDWFLEIDEELGTDVINKMYEKIADEED